MIIELTKMNGSGNDFILIDNRSHFLRSVSLPDLARTLCRRRESVGADGLILVEESNLADFKWRFFNADGSEAEMCGNGGRCVARYAYENSIAGPTLTFETLAGIIRAEIKGRRVKIELPEVTNPQTEMIISVDGKEYTVSFINTGVPHTVLMVDDLPPVPVAELGRKIRFHPAFQPAGTNVNFVWVRDSSHIHIRTYERGVEAETLACGTGSVASALVAAILRGVASPVDVMTQGGEVLTISFTKTPKGSFPRVFLEGDTCLVFKGTAEEDIWLQYNKLTGF